MKEKRYFISDAAKELEVESHVLRYWEEELNLEIPRNEMGHRYYRKEEIEMLKCVKELKARGFQLKTIRQILNELQEGRGQAVDTLRAIQAEEIQEESYENGRKDEQLEKENYDKVVPIRRESYQSEPTGRREPYQSEPTGRREPYQSEPTVPGEMYRELPAANQKENTGCAAVREPNQKMEEFEEIMRRIVGHAMKENSHIFGQEVGMHVSERVLKEMDYLMRLQEEREEKHFQNLDNTIRQYQRSKKEAAAAKMTVKAPKKKRRKSLFFQKRKKRTI